MSLLNIPRNKGEQPDTQLQNFIETHREAISHLNELFHSESYETYLAIKPALQKLLEAYNATLPKDPEPENFLPLSLFEHIIGRECIEQGEVSLQSLPEARGVYIPNDPRGGGDYWATPPNASDLGDIALVDIESHGIDTLYPKALLTRMIQLYKKDATKKSLHLFAAIDAFLEDLPIPFKSMEYMEGALVGNENERLLQLEIAGVMRCFIRDNDTGIVQYAVVPSEVSGFPTRYPSLKPIVVDRYPQLGVGLTKDLPAEIQSVTVPNNASIYFATDGLFQQQEREGIFMDALANFCDAHRALSGDEFRKKFIARVRRATALTPERDDVTILVLNTLPH